MNEIDEWTGGHFFRRVSENPLKIFVHPQKVALRRCDAEQVQREIEEPNQILFRPSLFAVEVRHHHFDDVRGVGGPVEEIGRQTPFRKRDGVERGQAGVQPPERIGGVGMAGFFVNLPPIDTGIRRQTREDFAQNAAEAEHVRALIDAIVLAAGLLGRDVRGGSEYRAD